MIPGREIKEQAREFGVPMSTIERDYVQNWFLSALRPINMALKGGTGIRKVYIENYRFSDDLDFTLPGPVDADTLRAAVIDAMVRVRDESGIQFEDGIGFRQTRNGFKATARFRILHRSQTSPIKIDLDLTSADSEQILLPVSDRQVFSHYSDRLETAVASYALEEIMAEKIRSVFQRTRSRDLYDIDQLARRVDREVVRSIVRRKCEYKDITVDADILQGKRESFEALWQVSLGHQIHDIPDFDAAFENVIGEIEEYSTEE
ncbi:MAG: nucleotidyl transferase AbiEii/AbiGii toxin family protein [Methanoregula sp.]|jgi:predicted nucleotidyltransferase component of viral defense system|nr:nucleotidyl transferase AbiEii/AbiGii toxin family protein [Methanoregula sp.]